MEIREGPPGPQDILPQRESIIHPGVRTYGFQPSDLDMNQTRSNFQKDQLVAGDKVFNAKRLVDIMADVYDEISADRDITKIDFQDEMERRIVLYLNQCFAFIFGQK